MHLAVVTNYYPDGRPLSEYGYHLVRGLRESGPENKTTVLAGSPGLNGDGTIRAWPYQDLRVAHQVLRAVDQLKPDGVMFNICFTSWGSNHFNNFSGLLSPWIIRRAGYPVIALLHHLPQTIDVSKAGYSLTPINSLGIEVVCRALSRIDVTCFPLERARSYFARRYHPAKTVRVEHGLFGAPTWRPPPKKFRCLAFGNWGLSKDPEPLIRFFSNGSDGTLVVAGKSKPQCPGLIPS